jgi:flagellar biosynthesis component FlhA
MQEAHRSKVVPFPVIQPLEAVRRTLECRIVTAPGLIPIGEELAERCRQLSKAFAKRWGFNLPVLVFETDEDLEPGEWSLAMRSSEVHRGRVGSDATDSIFQELLDRPWRLFSYESFRSRLQDLEEWEPFLAQEVMARLNLVLTWQIFQALLKNGGSLHRFSSKLERILVEAEAHNRDQLLNPRTLSSLQQC